MGVGSFCYKTLKSMLKNRMEEVGTAEPGLAQGVSPEKSPSENQLSLWAKENLRGQGYYH